MTRISKLKLLLSREVGNERRAEEKVSDRRVLENKYIEDCETMGYWDLARYGVSGRFKYSPTDWIKRQEYMNSEFKDREENSADVSYAVTSYYFWKGYVSILILAWFMHY
tara:strand:+ start:104 stop:433 length:330 start_codon:yes stop_codon:yes gene_type:complete